MVTVVQLLTLLVLTRVITNHSSGTQYSMIVVLSHFSTIMIVLTTQQYLRPAPIQLATARLAAT